MLLRVSINIAGSEYDKISAHFYCVNYRRNNRIYLTSLYDAKGQYLFGLQTIISSVQLLMLILLTHILQIANIKRLSG